MKHSILLALAFGAAMPMGDHAQSFGNHEGRRDERGGEHNDSW
ncbi:hypothetical protein [Komagataeibacter medellinensis]|nr:hypothetical protein [Komagataeibacter medellinensis]